MAAIIKYFDIGYSPRTESITINTDATLPTKTRNGEPLEPGSIAHKVSTDSPPVLVSIHRFLGPEFNNEWETIFTA